MTSKTKYYLENSVIEKAFVKAELGKTLDIAVLNAGEYNTAYRVKTDKGEYVIKIAPQSSTNILTYEQGIMAQEVYFYKLIAKKTTVKIPKVYFFDDSKEVIPSSYFIMEKLEAKSLAECKLGKSVKQEIYTILGGIIAKLHRVTNTQYGYCQNGLHENWYLAIKSMVTNLIEDCKKCNKKLKYANELLKYIEKYKTILLDVQSRYTHFDIWDGNIFYQEKEGAKELSLIDTERSFWGDCIGEFVSVEILKDLDKKVSVLEYNKTAEPPITFASDEVIRFNIMRAYLGLIVFSEKFFRYKKFQIKYIINVFMSKFLVKKSFKAIKRYEKNRFE